MNDLLKKPILTLSFFLFIAIAAALWLARAPTTYSGSLPIIGSYLPIKFTVIDYMLWGPYLTMVCCGGLWYMTENSQKSVPPTLVTQNRMIETGLLTFFFICIFLVETILSLQYFIILAPTQELCDTRPHFDFLWTNMAGHPRTMHCMSGTKEINAVAPYYIEPMILQSWGQILCPVLTLWFLVAARRAWISNPAKNETAQKAS